MTGIVRWHILSLRGTTWHNSGSSTWNGFLFEHHIRLLTSEYLHSWVETKNPISGLRPIGQAMELVQTVHPVLHVPSSILIPGSGNYSLNAVYTWCNFMVGADVDWPRIIHFLAALAQLWPSAVHQIVEMIGFPPLSGKRTSQFTKNIVYRLIGWLNTDYVIYFWPRWTNVPLVVKNNWILLRLVLSDN